ncbi:glycosyltransferase family 39 protein [Zavarzinella formosa]|uniref:glycosyltransferase family 39 protein n=1 Tax=Zavarzinella formosa TaxID=360055 RepID=UPI00030EC2E6|nr:glycosyltransferase family 39 protein [Zavarzinella formosa]
MLSPTVLSSFGIAPSIHHSQVRPWNFTKLTVLFVGLLTAFRIAYIFFWCPYDLAPDEAHYWDWSRHLDWSYYSKGPLVAWLIRGSVELFGGISLAAQGTMTAAVRVPAALCGGLFLLGIYRLAQSTLESGRLAFWCAALAAVMPAVNAFSLIMTIDAPYLACWVWAMVFGFEAMRDNRRWKWLAAGFVAALGILAKYTMAVWLGSFVLFLLVNPLRRSLLLTMNFWLMVFMASLSALPILIWNSSHEWVTFRHVAGQAGVGGPQTAGLRWAGPFEFVGSQAALLLGYWFVIGLQAMWANRPGQRVETPLSYLWWMSVPTLALFTVVSLKAPIQLNWPAGAYVGGTVLVVDFLRRTLPLAGRRRRQLVFGLLGTFLFIGGLGTVIIHESRWMTRQIARFLPPDSPEKPTRIRQFDPAARLKGWQHLAGELDRIRREFRESGQDDPILAGLRWDLPGEMGFYCEGHPSVYSLGLAMGDRHSQYDWWRPNPLTDAQEFQGKTFVFVGVPGVEFALEGAFDQVDPPVVVTHHEGDRAAAQWYVWVCRGYQGFGNPANFQAGSRH